MSGSISRGRVGLAVLLAALSAHPVLGQQRVAAGAESAADTSAAARLLERAVAVRVKNVTVREAVTAVTSAAAVRVQYRADVLDASAKRVTLTGAPLTLRSALARVLEGTGLHLVLLPEAVLVIEPDADRALVRAQQEAGSIRGMVVDSATGKGIPGVTLSVADKRLSVTSAANGAFAFPAVPAGDQVVTAKLLGYRAASRHVTVAAGQPVMLRFALAQTASVLSGVVTTATGTQRRLEVGNDIPVVNVDSVLRNFPVATMSDLLATRVPGVDVQRTSGAPGAPSKIRIRGLSSVNGNSDPIIILDGIRMYAAQGAQGYINGTAIGDRSANSTGSTLASINTPFLGTANPSPLVSSPIDQIDPNSIETIEVLKGPSAVALYGTDAANGVIVMTSKRGKPGPVQWSANASFGRQTIPGDWPTNYFMFGHGVRELGGSIITQCNVLQQGLGTCIPDSLGTMQLLNDPRQTVLATGSDQQYRADVRGGTNTTQWSLSGSASSTLGVVKMSDADVDLLTSSGVPLPHDIRRPQGSSMQSGAVNLTTDINQNAHVSLTSNVARNTQRTTPYGDNAISVAQGPAFAAYTNAVLTGAAMPPSLLLATIGGYRELETSQSLRFSNAVTGSVKPLGVIRGLRDFTLTGTAGYDLTNRTDQATLGRADCYAQSQICSLAALLGSPVDAGTFNVTKGTASQSTVNVLASQPWERGGLSLKLTAGLNYTKASINDLQSQASGLPAGATSGNGATTVAVQQIGYERATAGIFAEANLGLGHRLYIQPAVRRDAGSGIGSSVQPAFPKLSLSYVLSDEPAFQRLLFARWFTTLRLRAAYGQSGVQPDVRSKIATFGQSTRIVDGVAVPVVLPTSFGNSVIRPERTGEFEGGVDADFWHDRFTVAFTLYRKRTKDALIGAPGDPSRGTIVDSLLQGESFVGNNQQNLGTLQNNGMELTLTGTLLQTASSVWTTTLGVSRNRNRLLSLSRGVVLPSGSTRNVPGYPLNGLWSPKIVAYSDIDGNGIITPAEVVLSDSSVYLGAPYPNYESSISSNLRLFNRLTLGAVFNYQNGLTQTNNNIAGSAFTQSASNNLAAQAYMLSTATLIGKVQTVSTLRFTSFSAGYTVPPALTQRLIRGRQLQVSVQGSNLGLWSNYRGKDPNVSAVLSDQSTADIGLLPQTRVWSLVFGIY